MAPTLLRGRRRCRDVNKTRQIVALVGSVALLSAFVENVGALAHQDIAHSINSIIELWITSFERLCAIANSAYTQRGFGGQAVPSGYHSAVHGDQVAVHGCCVDSGMGPRSNHNCDLLTREVTMADPMACRRRARQCMHIAQTVRPGEVKQALLAIAVAWAKLAIQVDACKAPRETASR